ncbi:MAG: GIY-YIG nuclease family protein, partial [Candidatus Kapabacteria bacterium]|nr:GIY-YIG nuclease family protein [Candidatus Kapabacteria bacterium]
MKTRKELKEQYKQMKYKIGVFCIKNKLNGKVFLGSSTDLVAIWHSTKLQLELNSFPNSELQKDWNE